MLDQPGREIERQDELLQLLYWLEGEGFEGTATLAGLARFLAYPEAEVVVALGHLVRRGDVRQDQATGEYRLTETGHHGAARRFAEEFAPLLSQGHGECNDPGCECHTNPAGAAECHGNAHQGRNSH